MRDWEGVWAITCPVKLKLKSLWLVDLCGATPWKILASIVPGIMIIGEITKNLTKQSEYWDLEWKFDLDVISQEESSIGRFHP